MNNNLPEIIWNILKKENDDMDEFYENLKKENTEFIHIIERIQKKDRERFDRIIESEYD
jgi:hypothetical protein